MIFLYIMIALISIIIILGILEILQHNNIINIGFIEKLDNDIASSTFKKAIWILTCICSIILFIVLGLLIITFTTISG